MTTQQYEALVKAVEKLENFCETSNERAQNNALKRIIELACDGVNQTQDGRIEGVKQQASETLRILETQIRNEEEAVFQAKEQAKQEEYLRKKLLQLKLENQELCDRQVELKKIKEILESFGIKVDDNLDIDQARRTIEEKKKEMEIVVSTLKEYSIQMETLEKEKQEDINKALLNFQNIIGVVTQKEEERKNLEHSVQVLKNESEYLNKEYELLTGEKEKLQKLISERREAFSRHRSENEKLYKLLEETLQIKANEKEQKYLGLKDRLDQINVALDEAIRPYDDLIAGLMQERQDSIGDILRRVNALAVEDGNATK